MFELPLDAWYVWIGLAVVSSTVLGVVGALPSALPPDASGAAGAIDSVAASDHAAIEEHPLSNTDSVRLGADSVSLRGPGGTRTEALGYGPVTPVRGGSVLEPVLRGESPDLVFDSPTTFQRAIVRAQRAEPHWEGTERLVVRRVSWGEIDAVLVG